MAAARAQSSKNPEIIDKSIGIGRFIDFKPAMPKIA